MRGRMYYLAGTLLAVAATAMVVGALVNPGYLSNYMLGTRPSVPAVDSARREAIEGDYGVSFVYPQKTPDSVGLYIPEYDYIDSEQADMYQYIFDLGSDAALIEEDDAYYVYRGSLAELRINRYYNHIYIRYEKTGTNPANNSLIDEGNAVSIAESFLSDNFLPHGNALIRAAYADGAWAVTFHQKTGGLINHAHPVSVYVSDNGFITGMDYYAIIYEKFASTGVMSMKDAYYLLPTLEELGAPSDGAWIADLKRCELVYRFLDSILQPAYLFEGEIVDRESGAARPFAHYVSAARYQ